MAMAVLSGLPSQGQIEALNQFFALGVSEMKNPSAYLSGIVRSISSTRNRSEKASAEQFKHSRVSKHLENMYRNGVLKRGDIDDKLMQRLQDEPPELAILSLDLFADLVPADCRNRAAFLTAQLKVARSRLVGGWAGGDGAGRGAVGGGRGDELLGGPRPAMHPGIRGPMPGIGPGMMLGMMPHGMMMAGMRGPSGMLPPMMMPPTGMSGMMPPGGMMMMPMRPMLMPPGGARRGAEEGRGGGAGAGGRSEGNRKDYSEQQQAEGVRIDEFHTCSEYAPYVHPYAAKELQNLFDAGISLVDIMDAGAWRQLAALQPGEAIDVVSEVGRALMDPKRNIRNINAFFTSAVKSKVPGIMERVNDLEAQLATGAAEVQAPPRPRRMGGNKGITGMAMPQPETRLYAMDNVAAGVRPSAVQATGDGGVAGGPVYGYGTLPQQEAVPMRGGMMQQPQQFMQAPPAQPQLMPMQQQQQQQQQQQEQQAQNMGGQPAMMQYPQAQQAQQGLFSNGATGFGTSGNPVGPNGYGASSAPNGAGLPDHQAMAGSYSLYGTSVQAGYGGPAPTGGQSGGAVEGEWRNGVSGQSAAHAGHFPAAAPMLPAAQAAPPGYGAAAPVATQPVELAKSVQQRISQVVMKSAGMVRFQNFDAHVCCLLSHLAVPQAMAALKILEDTDKRNTVDMQALIISLIQQQF